MSAKELLIQTVGPAVQFVRSEAARADLREIDLDLARRLWVEQLTGVSEAGTPVNASSTLENGQHDSIPRIQEMRERLKDFIAKIRDNPEDYGITLTRDE